MTSSHFGYHGKILRVNLSNGSVTEEIVDISTLQQCLGGTGLGAKYLFEEVKPDVKWDSSDNRIIAFTGPLAGGPTPGSGTISFVTRGPMTNMAGSAQANGFFSAYLKSNGFDGLIIHGTSPDWVYLAIEAGRAELRDARFLHKKDTWETEDILSEQFKLNKISVYSIGVAGENLVRFAALAGDKGHVVAHNGIGAVFGAKKLKGIAVVKDKLLPLVYDRKALIELSRAQFKYSKEVYGGARAKWGTAAHVAALYKSGQLPIKNLSTSVWPHYEKFTGQYIRAHFEHKPKPCWACSLHCKYMKVTEGPYAGFEAEEPEYENLAGFGPLVGNTDPGATVVLSNIADRLGVDINECSWVLSWAMECFEKGILTKRDLHGLDASWGNVNTIITLMNKIANREGIGDLLAEGVKNASYVIGKGSEEIGVYTLKGASPRCHDHRARWEELLDTCLGNTGTIESSGGTIDVTQHGLEPLKNRFSPEEVAVLNARVNGRRVFEDCVPICRFCSENFSLLVQMINAATGWSLSEDDAMKIGKRTVNRLRVINLLYGVTPQVEMPSPRYGSAPVDGPAQGMRILDVFEQMRSRYWREMGWDEKEGKPLPETLSYFGLADMIPRIW